MDENDVKHIIASIRNQTKSLKDKVLTNIQVARPYTNKTTSSKVSLPYDPSLEDIRDTLENDESFAETMEPGMGRYPPLKLVPRFQNRQEVEVQYNYPRIGPGYMGSSNDQLPDEYSFHTPPTHNDGGIVSMKTAEFEGLIHDETEPDYYQNYQKASKRRPRKSPQEVSQRDSVKDAKENEDVRGLKQMVEALLHDNQVLQQDNEDFKKAMQMTVEKYKEVQRELENERKKTARIEQLEQQLRQEKMRNIQLNERNSMLKEKCTKFIDFLQHLNAAEEKEIEEEEQAYAEIAHENALLRDLLGISKISDPKFLELDQLLQEKSNEIEESKEDRPRTSHRETNDDIKITPDLLDEFRKDRERMFSMRRTLSIYSEKSDKATPKVGGSLAASTDNALEAASGTPSSTHSWEQIRFVNTSESLDFGRPADLSIERGGSDKKLL